MSQKTTLEFTFCYDGEYTFDEVITALIAEKILHQQDEKHLPKLINTNYNTDKVPLQQVSGLCKEAS